VGRAQPWRFSPDSSLPLPWARLGKIFSLFLFPFLVWNLFFLTAARSRGRLFPSDTIATAALLFLLYRGHPNFSLGTGELRAPRCRLFFPLPLWKRREGRLLSFSLSSPPSFAHLIPTDRRFRRKARRCPFPFFTLSIEKKESVSFSFSLSLYLGSFSRPGDFWPRITNERILSFLFRTIFFRRITSSATIFCQKGEGDGARPPFFFLPPPPLQRRFKDPPSEIFETYSATPLLSLLVRYIS